MNDIFKELRKEIDAGATHIEIPYGVTYIGFEAFYGCSGLTSIILPDSVTEIRGSAFDGCTSLTSIIIPNNVKYLGTWGFKECVNLKSVIITNDNIKLGHDMVVGCDNLEMFHIPEHLISKLSKTDKEIYDKLYLEKWNEQIEDIING